jgi:hypothetical protein
VGIATYITLHSPSLHDGRARFPGLVGHVAPVRPSPQVRLSHTGGTGLTDLSQMKRSADASTPPISADLTPFSRMYGTQGSVSGGLTESMLDSIVIDLSPLAAMSSAFCSPMPCLIAAVMVYKLPMMLTLTLRDDSGLSSVFW